MLTMNVPGCKLKPMKPRRYTTKQQFKIIDRFLLKHPKLPYSPSSSRLNGYKKNEVIRTWTILKNRLNALGPPERNGKGWKDVWFRRRSHKRTKNKEALRKRLAGIQPALPNRIEPNEFKLKNCNNGDVVFGIIEPNVGPETSQNDRTMSTISQDLPRGISKMCSRSKPCKQQSKHLDEFILEHPNLDFIQKKQGCQIKLLRDRLNGRGPTRTSKERTTVWKMRSTAIQPALPIRAAPVDGVFGFLEPDEVPETPQKDKNVTTTSTALQDEFHVKYELDEDNVHNDFQELGEENVHEDFYELDEENINEDFRQLDEVSVHKDSLEVDEKIVVDDSHELDVENKVHKDFHPRNSDEFNTQSQSEQRRQKCCCCCSSGTRTNEIFEKQFEMQTKFMQNLTEQRKNFHIEILKILDENNKLLKESLRKKNEENDAREVKAEELRLKKIELKLMKAINDVKIKKL